MTSPLKRKRDGAIYIEDEVTGFIRNKKRRNRAGIQKGSRSRVLQEPESSGGVIEVPREHATSSQLDCKASVEILAQKSGDNLEHSTQTAIEKVKKRRRTKSGAHDNNETGSKAGEDDETKSKDEKYKSRKKSHKKPHHAAAESRWNITQALGGRLINADPIVTNDGQHLLLACPSAINIYTTENSSLIRSLSIATSSSKSADITAYGLSPTQSRNLYVATSQEILYLFAWAEGKKLGRWKLGARVWELAIATVRSSEDTTDVVYTREQTGTKWKISAHKLRSGEDASKTESKTILSSSNPITRFKLIRDGKFIVATSGKRLLLGELTSNLSTSLRDLKYVWRELDTPEWITCFDVRESSEDPTLTYNDPIRAKETGGRDSVVDVVLGHTTGVIFVYEDIINKLVRQERQRDDKAVSGIVPRRMHWHREAVHSVKWTSDGNYVISGGSETVLVFWQLDTDRLDFLPHLSASIDSIVVAADGAAYLIRLSDNSVMILSSTELKPKTYIAGIQARILRLPVSPDIRMASSNKEAQDGGVSDLQAPVVPATISCLQPSRLLLAVPSSLSTSTSPGVSSGTPYLQTVDLATAHHVSRQALTRTNTTDLNIGPELNKIIEPNVMFIRASYDGRWLATVDEWTPPLQDTQQPGMDEEELWRGCQRRTEVFLKFWSWDSVMKQWELVTREDGPHSVEDGGPKAGHVMDLQADPTRLRFATVGQDGAVRIWKAKTRRRNNIVLKSGNGEPLMEWFCRQVAYLAEIEMKKDREKFMTARLAWSWDGSVLAASQTRVENDYPMALVYLIDPSSGNVRTIRAGLYTGVPACLAFVKHYLVVIGDGLTVWDTVQDQLSYGFTLQPSELAPRQRARMIHVAVDQSQGTFAISLPVVKFGKHHQALTRRLLRDARSELIIFDPAQLEPLYSTSLPHLITALVCSAGGYAALDSAGELRVVSDQVRGLDLAMSERLSTLTSGDVVVGGGSQRVKGVVIMAGEEHNDRGDREVDEEEEEEDNDDGTLPSVVVRSQDIAAIFDVGPAYALPPMRELFHQVATLVSKKSGSRKD